MNNTLKYLFCITLFTGGCSFASAQESRETLQQQIDSLQRIVLKDSMHMSDATITDLFKIRNRFFQQSDAIYANNALATSEQQNQIKVLRKQTDDAIRALLGDAVYTGYKDLIESRMKHRKGLSHGPLTTDN